MNVATFNHTLYMLIVIAMIHIKQSQHVCTLLSAVATYFDPRIIMFVFPMNVLASRVRGNSNIWLNLILQLISVITVWFVLASPDQLRNTYNIMMVNNSSENIGNFWYIMTEMFPDKLEFLKLQYLLLTGAMCAFMSLLLHKTYDMLDLCTEKVESKRKSLLINGILILSLTKLVMNQYPCLDDLSIVVFFVALNLKFIFRYVGALLLFTCGTIYAIMNSGFLWITWLKRFSGNANFFYFQTLVFQSFLVLFFIQIYMAVDQKRKKYALRQTIK